MIQPEGRVLVLGAGGILGRRIVELLRDTSPRLELITASRRPPAGLALPHRTLDLNEIRRQSSTWARQLEDIDLLIHAAGPFQHDPRPLVQTCLQTATHYLDIAEDPVFLARLANTARSHPHPRSAVLGGCSTIPALVALLARTYAAVPGGASLRVYLNLGSRNPAGTGLLAGLLAPLGRPMPAGERCFRRLVWRHHEDGITRSYGPYPFPESHLSLGEHDLPVQFFAGFDRPFLNVLLRAFSHLAPRLSPRQLIALAKTLLPLAKAWRPLGGEEGHLLLEWLDPRQQPLAELEITARHDGLMLPAAPAAWAAARLLAAQTPQAGLLRLEDLMNPKEAIQWIRARGYDVQLRKSTGPSV